MRRLDRYLAACLAAATVASCSLVVDLDGLSGGPLGASDTVAERAPDSPSPVDASSDETPILDGSLDAPRDAEAGPPITFVGASKVDPLFNVSSFDLSRPSGVAFDDVVVVGVFTDFAATSVQTPANFTKLGDLPLSPPADTHGWWYVHVVSAAEPAKTTFRLGASSAVVSAVALAYRNARVPIPVDVDGFAASAGNSYLAPSVTTTVARTMLVSLHFGDDTTSATWTAPAGMTTRAVTGVCAAFDRPFPNAGVTGPVVAISDSNASGQNGLLALAPRQ